MSVKDMNIYIVIGDGNSITITEKISTKAERIWYANDLRNFSNAIDLAQYIANKVRPVNLIIDIINDNFNKEDIEAVIKNKHYSINYEFIN